MRIHMTTLTVAFRSLANAPNRCPFSVGSECLYTRDMNVSLQRVTNSARKRSRVAKYTIRLLSPWIFPEPIKVFY